MKLKVDKTAMMEGLTKVLSIINPRTTLPVLSNVLLEAKDNKLWLSATDLEVSVQTTVDAEIDTEGDTTLPAKRISSIFRELPSQEVEIDVDEHNSAAIQCGFSFFKVVGISGEDFPPLPRFEGSRNYTLEQGVFKEMLQKTSYASSADETRPILNGVLLSFKGEKLVVVATDGRRLALVEQEVEFPADAEGDLVLPSKTVSELLKTLHDEGQIKIHASENQVAFEFGDMLIVSKLIEGTYPNFRQVIPSQCEERIAVEREGLLNAVKRVSLMANDQTSTVKLGFGKNRLQISTETPDVGEARESLPIKYEGKEIAVSFNPEFMMAPLRFLESDEIYVELTDDLSPGVIKSNVPFLYVLMPMRVG
ncbi:MAG: DNA polymerase III subunit beta [Spartobacteria bacterium]|nr:DNA polymerase III subunit beta [Spartobacteria bacterium]